jgi:hypothetical protein
MWDMLRLGKHNWPTSPHIHQSHKEKAMTKVQTAYLLATWNELGAPLCEHRKIDLKRNEDVYMTGNYRCLPAVARWPANHYSRNIPTSPSTVNGAFPSARLLTRTYVRRPAPTAWRTNSTAHLRICGNSSTILVYDSARFYAA